MNDRYDRTLSDALHARLDALDVPAPDLAGIAARAGARPARPKRVPWTWPAASAAAGVTLGVLLTAAAVGAGGATFGERLALSMRQAFTLVGLPVPENAAFDHSQWRRVTLEEAHHDAAFPLVAPSALPGGYRLQAVDVGTHRGDDAVQLTFGPRASSERAPSIVIIERAARPSDAPRDVAGGVAATTRADGSLVQAQRVGPAGMLTSSFQVNGTYVQTILLGVPDAPERARSVKSALQSGTR